MSHVVHVVHVSRATWDTWGWSRWIQYPKKPQIDPSHPSIAPNSEKLESEGVAVGGAPGARGTCVQGHVGHLGMI